MDPNRDNFTIRHYKGKIRDIESELKDAIARIKKLEDRLKNNPVTSPASPSNMSLFANDDINRGGAFAGSSGGGGTDGLTPDEIKSLVNQWIKDGDLKISIHDHTTEKQGGDSYANLGAALQ